MNGALEARRRELNHPVIAVAEIGIEPPPYPLPPSQSAPRPAVLVFDPGEIYDFEYTPATAEELTLRFGLVPPPPAPPRAAGAAPSSDKPPPPDSPPGPMPPPMVSVAIHVR